MVIVTSPTSSTIILSRPTGPRLLLTMLAILEAANTFCVRTVWPLDLWPCRTRAACAVDILATLKLKLNFSTELSPATKLTLTINITIFVITNRAFGQLASWPECLWISVMMTGFFLSLSVKTPA